MRRKMRRKNSPPEAPYTMAEVREMETESTILASHPLHLSTLTSSCSRFISFTQNKSWELIIVCEEEEEELV